MLPQPGSRASSWTTPLAGPRQVQRGGRPGDSGPDDDRVGLAAPRTALCGAPAVPGTPCPTMGVDTALRPRSRPVPDERILARLRLGPTRHARRPIPARACRAPCTRRSLVPSRRKPLSETSLNCEDRRGSRRPAARPCTETAVNPAPYRRFDPVTLEIPLVAPDLDCRRIRRGAAADRVLHRGPGVERLQPRCCSTPSATAWPRTQAASRPSSAWCRAR